MDAPSLDAIRNARARLADLVVTTPVRRWQDLALDRVVDPGTQVFLKEELFQRTGTFKPRGALSVMLDLPPQALARGVTAVSAGNHAMAVAYAADVLGTTAHVVMPRTASPFRVEACRDLGAEVELVDDVRSTMAQALLRDRARSIVDVAFELGYADLKGFYRAFKRWTQATPAEWRART